MTSYREAGVDVEAADKLVDSIASTVVSTWGDQVVGGFGGFASGVEIPDGYEKPVLMLSTDGVGTKLELARRSGTWGGVGFDLVAMCVDDLAAAGALPIGFVDYLAVGALHPDRDREIVASVASACAVAGCPLLGGETAEHPGVMAHDAVDLAGTALGLVEKGAELGPHRVASGDVVVGLQSPNLRSNGFSLVRAVFDDDISDHLETFLEPSVIYSPAVSRALGGGGVHAAAHITGGGLVGNMRRVVPDGLGARIEKGAWDPPDVFGMIAERGVAESEMYATFNMGIGFSLIVDPSHVDEVAAAVEEHLPLVIGIIDRVDGVSLV